MAKRLTLISLIVTALVNILAAQSTDSTRLQPIAHDSSRVIQTPTRQVNPIFPASGGTYIDATSTLLPYFGYSISGAGKAYTMYNGNTNQFEYHQSSDVTPDFLISGNSKAVFNTSFLGLGTSSATNSFTGLTLKNPTNSYWGMYIDAGITGAPFYGYALNGNPVAYTQFNGSTNQFEYYHNNGFNPDFLISSSTAAFQNTSFFGIGTTTPTTTFTGLSLKNNTNNWWGMYVDAGATGSPFYGYALNGVSTAYTQYSGTTNQLEYYHSNPSNPDFLMSSTKAAYPFTNFFGIGTSSPTTPFTGLSLKNNTNNWWGMYIDAGTTGSPFYGYALNGVATAYTQFSGTSNQYEYYHSNPSIPDFLIGTTNAAFPATTFLGIGTTTPTTGFTGLSLKKNANSFWGMYIDAGATGQPFYGYALNGTAVAYTQYNGVTGQFEYHHTTDATPDFLISSTNAAFPATTFLGIGTTTPTTGFTGLSLKKNTNGFWGMYIDAGASGQPFYGYALNGTAVAYTQYNAVTGQFEYHHTTDATPDFLISSTNAAFPATSFLGIGTTTPTTGFTGLALKSAANSFWGMYIDAGATGAPFYGYALSGTAKAYTQFSGTANQFEYHQSSDAIPDFYINGNTKAVFNTSFVGIGTGTATTAATGFAIKSAVNGYYGMYVDAGSTGQPFYGYALNGSAKAWTDINGSNNNWELYYNGVQIAVNSSGNVGLGTPSPAQKLDVNGTIHATNLNGGATSLSTDASGNIIRTPSDARLKCKVTAIEDPLDKVMQLQGVSYNFIDADRFGSQRQMGFLAQDLEKVVPETVSSGGEYKSVNYQEITALLTEAVKAQQKIIDQLQERIEQLEESKK
ncbi:MAG: tail fiber domain-containing protein [Bacteroidetes bacterium]|nr:tail fiber domain-containing protein [Bacteroidota bacterium]